MTHSQLLILFSLLFLQIYLAHSYKNLTFSLPAGQSHSISEFNSSIAQPQFVNHSCYFSTASNTRSTIKVLTKNGRGYINGYPLQGDVELEISESTARYFFDVTKQEETPTLVFQNIGQSEISVICLLFQGLDYFIAKNSTTQILDQDSEHYPLQCRLFTVGKNVPLEIDYKDGFVSIAGQETKGTYYVNSLEFVYVVEGSSHFYQLKNTGNADVDLLCQNF